VLVLLGGAVGSAARYAATNIITHRFGSRYPFGIMAVNVSGSFLIGLLMAFFAERYVGDTNWRPLLVVGFLGGYTTFSSFEWEIYFSIHKGDWWISLVNVVGSVTLGLAAVWLGAMLGRRWGLGL
jgi:CrcB protein